jgi:hypothetical protein
MGIYRQPSPLAGPKYWSRQGRSGAGAGAVWSRAGPVWGRAGPVWGRGYRSEAGATGLGPGLPVWGRG